MSVHREAGHINSQWLFEVSLIQSHNQEGHFTVIDKYEMYYILFIYVCVDH